MSDEIMLVFGEDGVAREYDDTWDLTIHCESEEEQKLVWEKLNSSSQELNNSSDGDVISRRFVELLAEYHDPEICPHKEYKGKPYFSIRYIENGEEYIGYGTHSPKVLSQYLREYFMVTAQPEQNAYEQGRITGRVEMRTEILSALKNMVGSEVWNNV